MQNQFPKEELYALGDQVRRAATSITANLAEGSGRQKEQLDALRPQFTEVAKMLSGLRNSLTVTDNVVASFRVERG